MHQLPKKRRQQVSARFLRIVSTYQQQSGLAEDLRDTMTGGYFRDHLPVVGCGPEYVRLERNDGDRIVA